MSTSGLANGSIFYWLSLEKIIALPGRQIDDLSLGRVFFFFVPSSNSLVLVLDTAPIIKGL